MCFLKGTFANTTHIKHCLCGSVENFMNKNATSSNKCTILLLILYPLKDGIFDGVRVIFTHPLPIGRQAFRRVLNKQRL